MVNINLHPEATADNPYSGFTLKIVKILKLLGKS